MHPEQAKWVKNKIPLYEIQPLKTLDEIVSILLQKYLTRSYKGLLKYKTTLENNNSDNYLQHLQEELMDGSLYIQKLLQQKEDITQLCNKYPNDHQLGIEIRKIYGSN